MKDEGLGITNVISLQEAKNKKKLELERDAYKSYLKLLQNEELEFEIKNYLEKLSSIEFSKGKADLGKLILEEIASRVNNSSPNKANSIEDMKKAIIERLDDFEILH